MREFLLLSDLANYHSKILVEKIIKRIKKIKSDKLIADLESNTDIDEIKFINLWEQFCARIQKDDDMFYFEAYEHSIKSEIEDVLKLESKEIRTLMCFEGSFKFTDYRQFYEDVVEIGESQNFDIIPELETYFLYDLICSEAASFTNKRIDAWVYLN